MLEPLVVKATRAVPRRERRSNPPDLSNEVIISNFLVLSTHTIHLEDKRLKSTSNKLENCFRDTLEKPLKATKI